VRAAARLNGSDLDRAGDVLMSKIRTPWKRVPTVGSVPQSTLARDSSTDMNKAKVSAIVTALVRQKSGRAGIEPRLDPRAAGYQVVGLLGW
jgi:hypothetical protein